MVLRPDRSRLLPRLTAALAWWRRLIASRVTWHLIALAALSALVFSIQRDALFFHLDGAYALQLIEAQQRWLPLSFSLGLDPYRGPGNLFFPFNFQVMPVYAVQIALFGHAGRVFTYVFYNCQNLLLLCLLAHTLRLPLTVGLLAGWGLALLTTPLIWTDQTTLLFPLHALAPHFFELTAFIVVFVTAFVGVGRVPSRGSWCRIGVSAAAALWIAASSPLTVACLALFPIVFVAVALALADGRERIWKLGALALVGAALYVSGAGAYVSGILRAGPLTIFGPEMPTYQSGLWWSSMFHQHDRFPAGTALVIVSVIATVAIAARAIRARDRSPLACVAITHALLTAAMIVAWPVLERLPGVNEQLRHLRVFYFEVPLLPFHALFAALALGWTARLPSLGAAPAPITLRFEDTAIVALMAAIVLPGMHDRRHANPYRLPALPAPTTRYLQTEIGLASAAEFRGRAVTLFPPQPGRAAASWDAMIASDAAVYATSNNDRRFVGLWAFGIPTLQEYSQIVAPPTYFWLTRAMSAADDIQDMRNHPLITRVNVPLLRLFGVRYVISPSPIPPMAGLALVLQDGGDRVYAVEQANVGQHFATAVVRVRDVADMLRQIRGAADLLERTFVFEDLPSGLAPGAVTIRMEPSAIHVTGRSEGTALVLLPFTYSRCYALPRDAAANGVRLVRANLSMLGLIFTARVDTTLTLSTGLFNRSDCLLADLEDYDRLGLAEAARLIPRGGLVPED